MSATRITREILILCWNTSVFCEPGAAPNLVALYRQELKIAV